MVDEPFFSHGNAPGSMARPNRRVTPGIRATQIGRTTGTGGAGRGSPYSSFVANRNNTRQPRCHSSPIMGFGRFPALPLENGLLLLKETEMRQPSHGRAFSTKVVFQKCLSPTPNDSGLGCRVKWSRIAKRDAASNRKVPRSCSTIHAAVGCCVTLTRTSFRRS